MLSYRTTNGIDVGVQLANDLVQMKVVQLHGGTIDVRLTDVYVGEPALGFTSDVKCPILGYYVQSSSTTYFAESVPSWQRVELSSAGQQLTVPDSSLIVFRDVLSMRIVIVIVVTMAESANGREREVVLIEREYQGQLVSGTLELSLPTELAEGLTVSGYLPSCVKTIPVSFDE